MGALGVVERKVRAESASQRIVGLVSFEVNVCVFDAAPEALAKDVVTFFQACARFSPFSRQWRIPLPLSLIPQRPIAFSARRRSGQ